MGVVFGKKGHRFLLGVATIALAIPSAAGAQETENTRNDSAFGQEIVVTATRQAETLSKVPVSVAAFSEKQLDQQGVRSIDDISRIAPGITFNRADIRNAGSASIAIRGISSSAGASTTGVYIDDTPIQSRSLGYSSYTVFPQVFDLDRVEVLRGPQGTLFGSGSQGGTVRFITPEPSLKEFSAYGRAEISTTENGSESWEIGAAVGGPLIEDKLAFRLSAWHRRDGGYVDRMEYDRPGNGGPYISGFFLGHPYYAGLFPGVTPSDTLTQPTTGTVVEEDSNYQDTDVIRGALRFSPTDSLDITAALFYQRLYNNDSNGYWRNLSNVSERDFVQGNSQSQPGEDEFLLPSLKIAFDAGPVTITSNTSYFDRSQNAVADYTTFEHSLYYGSYLSPVGVLNTGYLLNDQKNFTQELRIESNGGGRLNWVVGAFYTNNDQQAGQFNDVSGTPAAFPVNGCPVGFTPPFCYGPPVAGGDGAPVAGAVFGNVLNPATLKETQLAGFAQADFNITEELKLTAGVRVAKTEVEIGFNNFGPIVGPVPVIAQAKQEETPVTPKFGISYQATPDTLLYASAAKGFRTGGGNPEIGQGCNLPLAANGFSTYNSDTLWSYEVGAKSKLIDRRLQVAASAYYVDWQNIQQAIFLSCGFQFVVNGGSAVSKGFDAEISLQATDNLQLSTAIGYNHTQFQEDVVNPTNPNVNLLSKGDRIAGAPWQISSSANYTFPVAQHDGYLRADWQYISSYPDDLIYLNPKNAASYNPELGVIEGYHVVNLRLGVTVDNVDVSIFAKNLLNASPELSVSESIAVFSGSGPLLYQGFTLRPRTIGLTVTGRY